MTTSDRPSTDTLKPQRSRVSSAQLLNPPSHQQAGKIGNNHKSKYQQLPTVMSQLPPYYYTGVLSSLCIFGPIYQGAQPKIGFGGKSTIWEGLAPLLVQGGRKSEYVPAMPGTRRARVPAGGGARGHAVLALPGVRSVRRCVHPSVRQSEQCRGTAACPGSVSWVGVAPAPQSPAGVPCPSGQSIEDSGLCPCPVWCRGSGRRPSPPLGLPSLIPIPECAESRSIPLIKALTG